MDAFSTAAARASTDSRLAGQDIGPEALLEEVVTVFFERRTPRWRNAFINHREQARSFMEAVAKEENSQLYQDWLESVSKKAGKTVLSGQMEAA